MFGAVDLTDEAVRAAAEGSRTALTRVLGALEPQLRVMVLVRLCPTPAQLHSVDDISQQVLTALAAGISRLKSRTAAGLKAYASGIVRHQVADLLRGPGRTGGPAGRVRSLDSTVGELSSAGPLWKFLSASGVSPRTAAERDEQVALLFTELGRLKPEHRDVIVLAFFDQLPTGEIARQMGVSRPAASMLLIRAVRTLRGKMCRQPESGEPHGLTA
jgi:RNA polymerase sigma factor (sigma-70 family)